MVASLRTIRSRRALTIAHKLLDDTDCAALDTPEHVALCVPRLHRHEAGHNAGITELALVRDRNGEVAKQANKRMLDDDGRAGVEEGGEAGQEGRVVVQQRGGRVV